MKVKESMFSSKINALISQFANMPRCERLAVRQEEQPSVPAFGAVKEGSLRRGRHLPSS